MSIFSSLSKIGEVVAVWLNPERRKEVRLRGAIEAAEHIIRILEKSGEYKFMTDIKLKKWRTHYQKRFDAWKNG